jgi:hypothetical protein
MFYRLREIGFSQGGDSKEYCILDDLIPSSDE